MTAPSQSVSNLKNEIRTTAHANRKAQPDKDAVSSKIVANIQALPEYASAKTILYYVDVRDEVRTRNDLAGAITGDKKIVVPYCVDGELELFHLETMEELEIGMYKILEPKSELREVDAKRVEPSELDLVLVPGVGFDRTGGRTGHGKGYYDKLLENVREDTVLVGVAFECQLFPEIPMDEHDIYMNCVVTEESVFPGKRTKAS
jgi:5-formyltetrahydrofolate cyclo-ligase